MTSSSSYGISQVTLQFDLNRDIDAAAQDVQAAINAARRALPRNLPYPPIYSKVNPADTPIVTLALTSETRVAAHAERSRRHAAGAAAERDLRRRQCVDAGRHQAGGAHPGRPAAARRLRALARGHPAGDRQRQRGRPEGRVRRRVPVLHHRGERPARGRRSLPHAGDRLSQQQSGDAARRRRGRRRAGERQGLAAGTTASRPSSSISAASPAPTSVQTVKNIQARAAAAATHPAASAPSSRWCSDRTDTIRASIRDVQFTLVLAVGLVVLVVFVFLRTIRATIIAGVALPLSLIATFLVMWFAGFSLDNLSLMALTIGTGFVVDDAIVMIENIVRHMEEGESPYRRRAARRARDRLHHHLADRLADRGVHSAVVHDRPRRPHVPRIRADAHHRGRGLGDRVADAHADDVREAAAPRRMAAATA